MDLLSPKLGFPSNIWNFLWDLERVFLSGSPNGRVPKRDLDLKNRVSCLLASLIIEKSLEQKLYNVAHSFECLQEHNRLRYSSSISKRQFFFLLLVKMAFPLKMRRRREIESYIVFCQPPHFFGALRATKDGPGSHNNLVEGKKHPARFNASIGRTNYVTFVGYFPSFVLSS